MNFATFTGKHLCWKLLFNKVLGLQSAALFEKKTLVAQIFLTVRSRERVIQELLTLSWRRSLSYRNQSINLLCKSINSSLPFPPVSQTPRRQPSDYCRELTSAHRQQPHSNREPLVCELKLLTTKYVHLCLKCRHSY